MTSAPVRHTLSRRKGYRKPPGVVTIGRPTRWHNPYRLADGHSREEAATLYADDLLSGRLPFSVDDVRAELRGKDLACWCHPDQLCHGDVLMLLANTDEAPAEWPGMVRRLIAARDQE